MWVERVEIKKYIYCFRLSQLEIAKYEAEFQFWKKIALLGVWVKLAGSEIGSWKSILGYFYIKNTKEMG